MIIHEKIKTLLSIQVRLHKIWETLWARRYGKGGIEDKKVSGEPF